MSPWWRSSGWRWRGWSISSANSLERRRRPGFRPESGDHLVLARRHRPAAASPRPAAWSRTRAGAARGRPRGGSGPARRGLSSEARLSKTRSRPADIRWIRSARSPNSTTGILPTRRTPVTSRPTSASSGGSKVFITFIPGASADSTPAPRKRCVQAPRGDLDLGQLGHAPILADRRPRRAYRLERTFIRLVRGADRRRASEHQETRKGSDAGVADDPTHTCTGRSRRRRSLR